MYIPNTDILYSNFEDKKINLFPEFISLVYDLLFYDHCNEENLNEVEKWYKRLNFFEKFAVKKAVRKTYKSLDYDTPDELSDYQQKINSEYEQYINFMYYHTRKSDIELLISQGTDDFSNCLLEDVNNIFNFPSPLINIRNINLSFNNIKYIGWINNFNSLDSLDLSFNRNLKLNEIWNCEIESIKLRGVKNKILPQFKENSVRQLDLYRSNFIDISSLKNQKLQSVSIRLTNIYPFWLLRNKLVSQLDVSLKRLCWTKGLTKKELRKLNMKYPSIEFNLYNDLKILGLPSNFGIKY